MLLTVAPYLPDSPVSNLRLDRVFHGQSDSDPSPPPAEALAPSAPAPVASPLDSPSPSPQPARNPLLQAARVTLSASGYWSWALLDLGTGQIVGSADPSTTSDTASMVKTWIAADYLRRAAERGRTPSATTLSQLSTMIRDSDNTNAYTFHVANGNLASITRMISICELADTRGTQNSWSLTQMSTRDITRLAACLADGRAAGPSWTAWLLTEMRQVRGAGRFGVIQALPDEVAARTAIKNGWILRDADRLWHISCLAVGDGWALGVHARYRNTLGKDYGATICRSVGEQLMAG
ncbi:MAG: hypothetical protein KJO75_17035 [Dactylosporangium sp.]|nr:hypothetical protein [Dactylosporangium sp.]